MAANIRLKPGDVVEIKASIVIGPDGRQNIETESIKATVWYNGLPLLASVEFDGKRYVVDCSEFPDGAQLGARPPSRRRRKRPDLEEHPVFRRAREVVGNLLTDHVSDNWNADASEVVAAEVFFGSFEAYKRYDVDGGDHPGDPMDKMPPRWREVRKLARALDIPVDGVYSSARVINAWRQDWYNDVWANLRWLIEAHLRGYTAQLRTESHALEGGSDATQAA